MTGNVATSRHNAFVGLTLSAQAFLDAVPAGAVAVDFQGKIVGLNAELVRQFGYEPKDLLGQAVEVLVPTRLRTVHTIMESQFIVRAQSRAMGAGRPLNGQRKDGSIFPIEVGLHALETAGEQFVLAVVSDRSDRVRAEALAVEHKALGQELGHQAVVAQEMGHRVKNLMATVAALVSISAREAITSKQMEESLRGRIQALSVVIDLALRAPGSKNSVGSLSLTEVLRAVFAPFGSPDSKNEQVSLHGPTFIVGQRPAEVLALVFHELLTNALKYGALRDQGGLINVSWQVTSDRLEFCWREYSQKFTPVEVNPQGFGSNLLTRLIEGELRGHCQREVTSAGWTTRLSIPSSSLGS